MTGLCVTHKGCNDGLTAAWILREAVDCDVHQAAYHDGPPLDTVRGRDVILTDITWDVEGMVQLLEAAESVEVLDHHETATRLLDASAVVDHDALERIIVDQDRSAARIVWDEYGEFTDIPTRRQSAVPEIVLYVEDRDLWRNEYDYTPAITEWLYCLPRTVDAFAAASLRLANDLDGVVMVGEGIVELKEDVADAIATNAHEVVFRNFEAAVSAYAVRGTERIASILGNRLAQDNPDGLGVVYWLQDDGVKISLRSTDDGPNVARLAEERWGGGGHPNAAGAWVGHFGAPWWAEP